MTPISFRAMVVEETPDRRFVRRITHRTVSDLPKGDVLIKVHYSSLNYKDALSASGNKGVTRRYPHTPGVDAAGEVAESSDPGFKAGAPVLVTGHDMGMNTAGGFGQYIRVPAQWVVPLPGGLTLRESMMLGTAGFTAALSLLRLEEAGVTPQSGDILVTGATGGVGSLAVAILARAGYAVIAASGKPQAKGFLKGLGAKEMLDRQTILETPDKALLPGRFAGVIDTVGGPILSYAVRSTQYGGAVTCCGNAASGELHLTVYPFILRGIRLIGIDSAECPMTMHHAVWKRLAGPWKLPGIEQMTQEIGLEDLEERIVAMLAGGVTGRFLVNMKDN
ncbi:MAG: YhdH/YhfP family quinone oxidoreductase [Desulfobacterales bacterium]|nr:YhdH/YhfP family quinone oxidoreductase [Desulfobacterales bacterium]